MNKNEINESDVYIYADTEYNIGKNINGHIAIIVGTWDLLGVLTRCGGYEGEYVYYLFKDIQLVTWRNYMDVEKDIEIVASGSYDFDNDNI